MKGEKKSKLHAVPKKSTPFSLLGSSCASSRQNEGSSCASSRQNEHCTRPAGPRLYKPPEQTQQTARCKRLGGFSPCHKSATTSPAAMLWSTALADAGIRSKCWRYQIQARENIPTLSRVGVEPAHHFFTCAELTAKLANYRGGMLLAGLQSWQPGLNLSAARWWAAL